jgi:RNA polymerase sigma-70 factor (ECF subfamily)
MATKGLGVAELSRETGAARAEADAVDATLAASGDAQAFERLYRAHVARVHSLARRMLSSDDAGELTQDVFVRAWQKLSTFRGEAAFGTWLHRVAINVILAKRQSLAKARSRFADSDDPFEQVQSRSEVPGFGVDFEAAVERLPEGARQVFVLHDVEGYKHHEIAEMQGVTVGTSKAQLHRARMTLRKHLERSTE